LPIWSPDGPLISPCSPIGMEAPSNTPGLGTQPPAACGSLGRVSSGRAKSQWFRNSRGRCSNCFCLRSLRRQSNLHSVVGSIRSRRSSGQEVKTPTQTVTIYRSQQPRVQASPNPVEGGAWTWDGYVATSVVVAREQRQVSKVLIRGINRTFRVSPEDLRLHHTIQQQFASRGHHSQSSST